MSLIPSGCNVAGEFWFESGGDLPDYRVFGMDDDSGVEEVLAVAEEEGVRDRVVAVRISDRIIGSESNYPWEVRLTWKPEEAE